MSGDWEADKAVARAMLSNRGMRRKALAVSLMIALGFIVLGLWVIDGWLEQSAWLFLLWWGACGLVTLWVLMFAFYDALKSVQEAKDSSRK